MTKEAILLRELVVAAADAYQTLRRDVLDLLPAGGVPDAERLTQRQQRAVNCFEDAEVALAVYRQALYGDGAARVID